MNIFFLSLSISRCAKYHCDKHVVKMILEMTQLLWTAHHCTLSPCVKTNKVKVYRLTHKNHPMAMWVRSSIENYNYTVKLALKLCKEYTRRYIKTHKCQEILKWLKKHPIQNPVLTESDTAIYATEDNPVGCTRVPLCITKNEHHRASLIESYREYYRQEKRSFTTWKNRDTPKWMN